MSTNVLADTLVSSCEDLYKKGVIGDTGLEKCKKMKEVNLLDRMEDVDKLENKIYKDEIKKYTKKSENKYQEYKNNLHSILDSYRTNETNNINNQNNQNYSLNKNNIEGKLNDFSSNLTTEINKLKQKLNQDYGSDKYKELVSNYTIIENNRNKENEIMKSISLNKQKFINHKNKLENIKFRHNFSLFIAVLLTIICIILFIVYFYKL